MVFSARAGKAKRKLASGVSNDQIDVAVDRALQAGATGVKVTGAGGGGFLVVICPVEDPRAPCKESLRGHAGVAGQARPLGSRIMLERFSGHLSMKTPVVGASSSRVKQRRKSLPAVGHTGGETLRTV